jgi:hypothetical protein
LKTQVLKLKKLVDVYKKRYYRLLAKMRKRDDEGNKDLTPRREVKAIVGRRKIPDDVKEKLLEHAVLERQLKKTSQEKSRHRDKDVLGRVLAGNIVKKYRKLTYIRKFAPKRCMMRGRNQNETLEYRRFSHTPRIPSLPNDVCNFLERDCNSRIAPGVSDTITKGKVKKQRRYLLKSLQDLHKEFQGTVQYSISYSKFCRLRPFWILFPQVKYFFLFFNFSGIVEARFAHHLKISFFNRLTEGKLVSVKNMKICLLLSKNCIMKKSCQVLQKHHCLKI